MPIGKPCCSCVHESEKGCAWRHAHSERLWPIRCTGDVLRPLVGSSRGRPAKVIACNLSNVSRDCETGCRRRRRCITDVQRPWPMNDRKVLNQYSVRVERLRAYAASSGHEVISSYLRHKLLQSFNKSPIAHGSEHFIHPITPVFSSQSPEAAVGKGFERIAGTDLALPIPRCPLHEENRR